MLRARGLFRRLWCFAVVALMLLVVTGGSFAESSSIPKGASVAPMKVATPPVSSSGDIEKGASEAPVMFVTPPVLPSGGAETNGGEVVPQDTRYGDAGRSWIYTHCYAPLAAQAAYGVEIYSNLPPMLYISWTVDWGDGQSTSGRAFPYSRKWTGESTHKYSSSGWYLTAFNAFALATDLRTYYYSAIPTSWVYVY
ncbi:hypothetical protein [Desulfothermobacter acidiphilus]|uniref:hypothetical protein n=1 Tax=Desulfothermobacter acidiphilus TaxID=1938353 RepID=UPI003F8CB2FB